MKERPILFSGPMARAILDGTKTQTRRIVKPFPPEAVSSFYRPFATEPNNWHGYGGDAIRWYGSCPYGQPGGDRLYVRETWAASHAYDHLPPHLIPRSARIHYAATEERGGLLWRPSIHMPRWASRITLEITDVRVERLQDISEADSIAEGVIHNPLLATNSRESFMHLWGRINGPRSWDANPWVWAITFKRLS